MKKMMKAAVCSLALVASFGLGMIAEAGRIPSHMVPLQTYATKKVTCYVSPGGAAKGWIDPGDYVIVNQIRSDGWAYGSYPTPSGRVSRWFRVDDLLNNPSFRTLDRMSPQYKINVYKNYSYNGTIGSVWGNEDIWVVSNLGDVWQIVYKVNSGGYKMGWVPYWDCLEKPIPSTQFAWPVPGYKTITARDTYPSSGKKHSCRYYLGGKACGIDISVPVGVKIYAPAGGIVQNKAFKSNGFGYHFEIKHDDGTITLYAHLSDYSYVSNGKRVNKGDLIAKSGNTGNTTGPHLHFEMSNKDPYQYYKNAGVL